MIGFKTLQKLYNKEYLLLEPCEMKLKYEATFSRDEVRHRNGRLVGSRGEWEPKRKHVITES